MPPEVKILIGDCLDVLAQLPEKSIHCVVTSPPYLWLRNYQIPPTTWPQVDYSPLSGMAPMTIEPMVCCLGLESSVEAFIGHLVHVFRGVSRVLRDDGTLWVNFGDSFNSRSGQHRASDKTGKKQATNRGAIHVSRFYCKNLAAKQLIGVPWRLALALQADGWYLRSDCIWSKSNPMPESVVDRPTMSHEYVFLLAKQPQYFYDWFGVREPAAGTAPARSAKASAFPTSELRIDDEGRRRIPGVNPKAMKMSGQNSRAVVERDVKKQDLYESPDGVRAVIGFNERCRQNRSYSAAMVGLTAFRNLRSVWSIRTHPFPGKHFATFPPKLAERCIIAGTSERGCCPTCGTPWIRVIEKGKPNLEHQQACGGDVNGEYHGKNTKPYELHGAESASTVKARILAGMVDRKSVGFKPSCSCFVLPPIPCVCLDPFGGSGTVGEIALKRGRSAIIIEIGSQYEPLIKQRVLGDIPLLSSLHKKQ